MKTILVGGQKGGVGKSTIANALAFGIERRGFTAAFANADNQHDSVFPERVSEEGDDFQVVDSPGYIDESFAEMCSHADLILLPMMASSFDLEVTIRCFEIANEQAPGRTFVVLNTYDKRGTVDRDLVSFLEDREVPILGLIPRAVAVRKAQIRGIDLFELDCKSPASVALEALTDSVLTVMKGA